MSESSWLTWHSLPAVLLLGLRAHTGRLQCDRIVRSRSFRRQQDYVDLAAQQNACTGEAPAKPGTDKDFWNRALHTPIDDKEAASSGKVQYPDLYKGGAGMSTMSYVSQLALLLSCTSATPMMWMLCYS